MSAEPITIDGHFAGFGWELFMDEPDARSHPALAHCIFVPVPSVGDTIWLEDCNGPLTVKRIEWDVRRGYPLIAIVVVG